ncbi:hypothetical protein AMEX_G24079 [Astyanax mexicanus]|uniref:Uncharacterized protein n=1 Tax=Astyanax mexicanus TaxID=7994 RepID=A0A8T2KUH8_ASTMX|nr:hypothetical protein AMEX_G24079 [Astyanax mexicanus]
MSLLAEFLAGGRTFYSPHRSFFRCFSEEVLGERQQANNPSGQRGRCSPAALCLLTASQQPCSQPAMLTYTHLLTFICSTATKY